MVSLCGNWWRWDNSLMETSTPSRCWISSNKDIEYHSQWTALMNFLQSLPVVGLCRKTNGQVSGSLSCAWRTSLMHWVILFERKRVWKISKWKKTSYGVLMFLWLKDKLQGRVYFISSQQEMVWSFVKDFPPRITTQYLFHIGCLALLGSNEWLELR